jgi:hypothetical protein
MYQLGLCELHCWKLHGGNKRLGHYLLISTFANFTAPSDDEYSRDSDGDDSDDDSDDDSEENILSETEYYNETYREELATTKHGFIRNYHKIISSPNYIKPEIIKVFVLDTGERVAILKTFWIRIFQRVWRRKFAKRLAFFKNIHNINMTRLTGRNYYRG